MATHKINGLTIETDYWAKPIPPRQFDWEASCSDYEPGDPMGWGSTEAEAIVDLLGEIEERGR